MKDWEKIYNAVLAKALELKSQCPYVGNLPLRTRDPLQSLIMLQEWCLEAQKRWESTYYPSIN